MSANVSILEATASDVPQMADLCVAATESDLLNHVLYSPLRSEAARKQTESLTRSLGQRFSNPTNRCHIVKAEDNDNGDLIGWSLVRWEDGGVMEQLTTEPDRSNLITFLQQTQKSTRLRLTEGKPHVVLGAVHVRPDRQRQGMGTQLVQHVYQKYDLDSELVILQTRAAEGFYRKLGWVTVASTDIDLSEWMGKGKGYGPHSSPWMLRYPQPAKTNK